MQMHQPGKEGEDASQAVGAAFGEVGLVRKQLRYEKAIATRM